MNSGRARYQGGWTLIEMVMVIAILGALVGFGSWFIIQPFVAFDDTRRRAELVAAADAALVPMRRELRAALPNSIRIGGDGSRVVLEFIPTVAGGRYRARAAETGIAYERLDFEAESAAFDVLGSLGRAPPPGSYAVVYNLSAHGAIGNAYAGDNRAPIDAAASSVQRIVLQTPYRFPHASPAQRFHVVTTPVSYVCDRLAGTLTRYRDYGFTASLDLHPGGHAALAAHRVRDCHFAFEPGAGLRTGVVTLRITVADGSEEIELVQQVHVVNAP